METSYFAKLKDIEFPIAICGKSPAFYKGPEYKKLAPKYWFFMEYKNGKISKETYTEYYYKEVLNKLNPIDVVNDLTKIYNTDKFTLLCYEKVGDFCHRHIVADWLTKNGFNIGEKCNE